MPRGGARPGAGRKKVGALTRPEALKKFNEAMASSDTLLRPEEILFRVANGISSPDGDPWTAAEVDAAKALLPYSIAKPASVSINHVTRTDIRQHTDAELEHIVNKRTSGGGTFAASESPLFIIDVQRGNTSPDGAEAGEAP